MPAMVLIRVDLPAPLSPTSAVTLPGRAAKSTSVSAWTAPKRLLTPRSSSRGAPSPSGMLPPSIDGWRGGHPAPPGCAQESPSCEHIDATAPVQSWAVLMCPSEIIFPTVSLALALVAAIGVRMIDGTSFWPLLVLSLASPSAADLLPLTRLTASSAACSASGLIALYTVMYCSPVRT